MLGLVTLESKPQSIPSVITKLYSTGEHEHRGAPSGAVVAAMVVTALDKLGSRGTQPL